MSSKVALESSNLVSATLGHNYEWRQLRMDIQ